MVAYSFKGQFREPILSGSKRQTIRADRKRHARPGEILQLYTGMRTRHCSIIGTAVCVDAEGVRVGVERGWVALDGYTTLLSSVSRLDDFAQDDGFDDWAAMRAFWRVEHPDTPVFNGILIQWACFTPGAANGP